MYVCVRLCIFILPPHKSLRWTPDSHPTYYWRPLGVVRDCNPETGSGIDIHLSDNRIFSENNHSVERDSVLMCTSPLTLR